MKETRKCVICPTGEFTVKSTSNRRTCCTACSREHTQNIRTEYHKRPEIKERIKKYKKIYYQRQCEKNSG